jgi:hypothetical protein
MGLLPERRLGAGAAHFDYLVADGPLVSFFTLVSNNRFESTSDIASASPRNQRVIDQT